MITPVVSTSHTNKSILIPANNKVKNLSNLIWNLLAHGSTTKEIEAAFKSRGVALRTGGVVYRLQTARKVGLLTTSQRVNAVRGGRPTNVWGLTPGVDRVAVLSNVLKLTPPQIAMIKNQRTPDEAPAPAREEILGTQPCLMGPMLPPEKGKQSLSHYADQKPTAVSNTVEAKLPLPISLLDLYRRSRKLRDTVDDQETNTTTLRREVNEARNLLIECQATINRASKELFSARPIHESTARLLQKTYDAIDTRETARTEVHTRS